MALLSLTDLSFSHDGVNMLFDNVSLQLDTNWKLGLIGRNGRGKTTFLRLLCGEYAHSGVIASPVRFDYFPFAVPDPCMTVHELAEQVCPGLEPWQLERETSLMRLSPEALSRPVSTLSGGEATKALLGILFLRQNNFLLIDEPTNHLDAEARLAVGEYLKRKKGFIIVSHDRRLLDTCVDHVLSINRAGIDLQRGNYSSWQENHDKQEQFERAENDKLRKEVTRLGQAARRSAGWSAKAESAKFGNGPVDRGFIGHKAAKVMKKARSAEARRHKALEDASLLLNNVETDAPVSPLATTFHARRLAEAVNLGVAHDDRYVFEGLSFSVMNGDRLVVRGGNGCGKSTLLRLLAGERLPFTGSLTIPGGLRVSYVPQDTSHVGGRLRDFARDNGIDEHRFRAVLHRLGFDRPQFEVDMEDFSAGQKKKALLGCSLCQEAHLYVWDEPLNAIDVMSRIQIEAMILEYRPSMVIVEHDAVFTERVGTAFLDLKAV